MVAERQDQALAESAGQGDKDAFRQLVEKYQRRVLAVVTGMLHDPEAALEVTQEAFIKAYKSLPRFRGQASFYTWIYRIVVNLGIDHIRKSGRVHKVDYDDKIRRKDEGTGDMSILPSRLDADPSKVLMRRELLDKMQAALETLSPNHRTILLLREVEGLSYDEMSEILDVSKGTVMSRLHHARKNMQRALKGYVHKEQTD